MAILMEEKKATPGEIQDAQSLIRDAQARPVSASDLDFTNHKAIDGRDKMQDIGLKKMYAICIVCVLGAQLIIANGVFVAYAWAGVGWHVPAGVMAAWLSATLVEIVGIVAIVTRSLFPNGGGSLLTAATMPESVDH